MAKTASKSRAEEAPDGAREAYTLDDQREVTNILYYGEAGTGKTTNLATMANLGRVLFINAEAGLKRRPLVDLGVEVGNIDIFPNPGAGERVSFDALENLFWSMKAQLDDDPNAYIGTMWDSVSEIYRLLLDDLRERGYEKAKLAGKQRDRFFTDRDEYGIMSEQVRLLIRRFRDLPIHFGVSALERRQQDEDDGTVTIEPSVNPALQGDLRGWMDMVCRTYVEETAGEVEFWGLFRPIGKYRGKDRLGATPKRLIDPTFERVVGYVSGDLDIKTDPAMAEARARRKEGKKEETA